MLDLAISASFKQPASAVTRDKSRRYANRILAQHLERNELWIADDRYHQILAARQTLRSRLSQEIQLPLVSVEDWAATSFGSERRFHSNISRCLAFGYEISFGLRGLLTGNDASHAESAVLGAIFNLGIARFDRVFDHLPGGASSMARLFNEDLLRRLYAGTDGQTDLAALTGNTSNSEVRFLLGIISLFFFRLEKFSRVSRDSAPRQMLNELLLRAYRAQIACARVDSGHSNRNAALLAVEEKSCLPFSVLLQLIRVCDSNVRAEQDEFADRVTHHVATAFWLIDDLVDLKDDFRNGHANAILLHGADSPVTSVDLLSRGKIVESVADRICASLNSARQAFQQAGVRSTSGHGFDEVLLCYARKWIEGGKG